MFQGIKKLLTNDLSFYFSNPENKLENKTEEVLKLASLTKPLISHYIRTELVDKNFIQLSDSFGAFFPKFPLKATVLELLEHKSGVWDYLELSEEKISRFSLDEVSHEILNHSKDDKRGEYSYSNSGFVLLSKIIEVIRKGPYEK